MRHCIRLLFGFMLMFVMVSSVFAAELTTTPVQLYYPSLNTVDGNVHGKVSVVEFFDYRCAACQDMPAVLFELIKNNSDVRIVYREYPLLGHTSIFAAEVALSAQHFDKYLAVHRSLIASKEPLNSSMIMQLSTKQGLDKEELKKAMVSPEVVQQLNENIALGKSLGVNGIPIMFVAATPAADDKRPINAYMLIAPTLAELQMAVAKVSS